MVAELLLEIGTEEIPAGYLKNGLGELKRSTDACLKEARIEMAGGLYTYGTPRRMVLIGKAIAENQEDVTNEVTGPPKKVAYDENGNPTKAALGFAERQGVSVGDLEITETKKGEYLFVKTLTKGRQTRDILAESLPKLIADISWPKSMRWGDIGFSFSRPIHWVLAIFGGEVIPFEVAGVSSGNTTQGHRFMSPQAMEVLNVEEYLKKMERSYVLIDQSERERSIEKMTKDVTETVKGDPGEDAELVSTVSNLVEYPSAVCGSFDESFLKLPTSVLITAMKEHQKYFAVYDAKGELMPHFVAINNTIAKDESVVKRGHERVLRARLSDADFFFREDMKRTLEERLEDLKEVIYQAELGTSFAKVQRFTKLAEHIAQKVLPGSLEDVRVAARLCKCDLVTQMVMEFPSLQGTMGKEYALLEKYSEEISEAIQDHYLPAKSGGALPTSEIGAVVGLADRLDTIAGCFAIGLEPTGTADPFALRRHALAIIRIVEDRKWDLSLGDLIHQALAILSEKIEFNERDLLTNITAFFRERYKQMMLRSGFKTDLIEAVISVEFDRINQLRSRIGHLRRFAEESDEFEALALTFKRVTNILKKQKESFDVDPTLFCEPSESKLWETYQGMKKEVYDCLSGGAYFEALDLMSRLRKPVDDLFDGVEILIKDNKPLRENRIGLLQNLADLFLSVADFSKFSI